MEKIANEEWENSFHLWWESHGQFCRAGGGDYEKTFAYRAWEYVVKNKKESLKGGCNLPPPFVKTKEDDRELLELAAKAAGITCWIHCFGVPPYMGMRLNDGSIWNPLTNDGDAFRLVMSVKSVLKIELKTNRVNVIEDEGGLVFITEDYNGDPIAATRRAIVRAAAEIGRRML